MLDAQSALVYTMVLAAAADATMSDREIEVMSDIVRMLPVFEGWDTTRISGLSQECADLMADENGIDKALEAVDRALPLHLRETAYALACDVVAADGTAVQEELRLLEMLRHKIGVGRLEAAAIERGARARFHPA